MWGVGVGEQGASSFTNMDVLFVGSDDAGFEG